MRWTKRTNTNSVLRIVTERTGMSQDMLLNDMSSYKINNLVKAVELYMYNIKHNRRIVWYTDYDADGIVCGNISRTLNKALKVDAKIIVPKRFSDGYGIKVRHVEDLDCDLLVLADNGIAAIDAVAKAREKGIHVIILDHHEAFVNEQKQVVLPNADVIVDPHITGGDFTDYCGAGLCYKFAIEVLRNYPYLTMEEKNAVMQKISAFAAIGTIADVVSLTGENRRIVKIGVDNILKHNTTSGLQELLNLSGMREYTTASSMAYFLCPQFNAYGRLDDNGSKLVSAFTSYDDVINSEISSGISQIKDKNEERKELANDAFARAELYIKANHLEDAHFIVFIDEAGSIGINGLTSGKITEKYKRPSIVVSPISDTLLKGSGRSRDWANLKAILDENNSLIEAYGGHPGACGITLSRENIEAFTEAVNKSTPEIPDYEKSDEIFYDIDCPIDRIEELDGFIARLEPYGQGNPELVVRIDNIPFEMDKFTKLHFKNMGSNGQHVKLKAKNCSFVWWNGAEEYKALGKPKKASVLCTLGYNVWNGNKTVQAQIIAMVPSM